MNSKERAQIVTVEVTGEEYQADLARGFADDETLASGRHTFQRGAFLKRHGLTPEPRSAPAKVSVSIDLDQDVFEFIKECAAESTNSSYEAEINEILRTFMESKSPLPPLSPQAAELLADNRFIDALAKQVATKLIEPTQ